MKRSNRLAWMGAIALAAIVLLSLIAAPNNTKINIGSTYNRASNGYSAWYAFMQEQGISIKRWQKPFSDIQPENSPVTLLQVNGYPRETILDSQEREWLEKGNTLVILGAGARVTEAEFLIGADLSGLILDGLNFIRGNLSEANLQVSSLVNADLLFVNFTKADLRNADLRGATLDETIWLETLVDNCQLGVSIGLNHLQRQDLQVRGARFNSSASLRDAARTLTVKAERSRGFNS